MVRQVPYDDCYYGPGKEFERSSKMGRFQAETGQPESYLNKKITSHVKAMRGDFLRWFISR